MVNGISGLSGLSDLSRFAPMAGGQPAGEAGPATFQDAMFQALRDVNQADSQSQMAIAKDVASGDGIQVDTMVQAMQVDLALKTTMQIRNKLMEAWNEIRQMQM